MSIIKSLSLSLLIFLSPLTILADGKETGGGGAGIKIGQTVYSLSEAGLKVRSDIKEPFYPDVDTLDVAESILKEVEAFLPKEQKALLRNVAFGNSHRYQELEVVDAKLFEQIKTQYQNYVDSLPVKGAFTLIAYTAKDRVTYILPDWTNATPETRALFLLTHEAPYSIDPSADLGKILEFENLIYHFHKAPKGYSKIMNIYRVMTELKILSSDNFAEFYIYSLNKRGIEVHLGDLLNEFGILDVVSRNVDVINYELTTDPLTLRRSTRLDSEFFTYLYRRPVQLGTWWMEDYCPSLGIETLNHREPSESQIKMCVGVAAKLKITSNGMKAFLIKNDGSILSRIHLTKRDFSERGGSGGVPE